MLNNHVKQRIVWIKQKQVCENKEEILKLTQVK